jgi:hypothetical protein
MITQISYNVLIERFKAFASGHYLIKQFTHGHPSVIDIEKGLTFPWMHVFPVEVEPRPGSRLYSFIVTFADLPRDKETPAEYEKEVISDCIKLAEDLVAEIQNGLVLFGPTVELEGSPSIEVFIQEFSQTLTGVNLALTLSVPWDWSACDIPADWTVGGSGSGGSGSGVGLLLQTNGVDNGSQSLLNLQEGTNVTITDNGNGTVTISASGGGGGGDDVSTEFNVNHTAASGNPYIVGDRVWYNGNVYQCIANNDALLPTNTAYWLLLGPGFRLRQTPVDWNATSGDFQVLNKPTIPDVSSFVPYTGATQNVDLGTHSLTADNGTNNSEINPSYFGVQNAAGTKYSLLEKQGLTVTDSVAGDVMNVNSGGLTFPDTTSQYTAAVNADWNAVGGLAEILNKPTIPTALDDLSDVNAPTPGNGQVLAFNSTSSEWEAVTPSSGGSVTSVGLTMPSAFNVSGSPVTTAGTLAVTGAGNTGQYVRGDGTLANFPSTGGGGGQIFYFNGNIAQPSIGGNNYFQLGTNANTGPAANFTRATTGVIARFITDVNSPNHLIIPSGVWTVDVYLSETGGGSNNAEIVAVLKVYNGSTFTTVATSPLEQITNGNVPDLYTFSISVPSTVTAATDRVYIEFDIQNTNGKTVTLYTEGNKIGEVHSTYAIGLSSLNGLTDNTQTFATGTAGTDFGINSSGSIHTFNLPTASASNRGALSSSDWSAFNGKQNSIGLTTVGTALATLPDPSAVRYLRINAGNTVSALTLTELKTDLGLGTIALKSSNQSSAITTYADITDLNFPVVSGRKYRFKIVALYDATNTATGSRWSINSAVTFSNLLYYVEWSLTSGGASTRKGYTSYDEETTANATSAFTTGNVAVIEGIILPTSTGTINARFASELTITSITCKAGSYVEWEEVL